VALDRRRENISIEASKPPGFSNRPACARAFTRSKTSNGAAAPRAASCLRDRLQARTKPVHFRPALMPVGIDEAPCPDSSEGAQRRRGQGRVPSGKSSSRRQFLAGQHFDLDHNTAIAPGANAFSGARRTTPSTNHRAVPFPMKARPCPICDRSVQGRLASDATLRGAPCAQITASHTDLRAVEVQKSNGEGRARRHCRCPDAAFIMLKEVIVSVDPSS